MYLSMWILAEKLKDLEPDVDIIDGKCILQNVRFTTKNLVLSPSTVYLFSLDEEYVQCLNQDDVITLHTNDITMVLNRILDLFEFYNNWENNLIALIESGITSHELLESIYNILPYHSLLADDSYYIYEQYGPQIPKIKDNFSDYRDNEGMLPLSAILEINQNPLVRKKTKDAYPITLTGGVKGVMSCNLFCNDEREGWIVALNPDNHFSQGELHLLSVAALLVERWLIKTQHIDSRRNMSGLFLDIMSDAIINWGTAQKRLQAFNWMASDTKYLYVFHSTINSSQHFILDSFLKRLGDNGFTFYYEDTLCYIANSSLENINDLEEKLIPLLVDCNFNAGKSQPFQGLDELKTHYNIAKIASAHPTSGFCGITDYADALVPYSINLLSSVAPFGLKHPAIDTLCEYDQKHNSDFAETLRVFIELERNYTDTAKALNIHRSTLIYRIERITEMTGLDLDNANIRFHLLLSFRM